MRHFLPSYRPDRRLNRDLGFSETRNAMLNRRRLSEALWSRHAEIFFCVIRSSIHLC